MHAASTFIIPPPELGEHVERIWLWQGSAVRSLPLLLPGTGAEVVFQLSGKLSRVGGDAQISTLPPSFVVCPRHSPHHLVASGRVAFLSVRFRLSSLRHFTALEMGDLIDEITPLGVLFGPELDVLHESILSEPSLERQANLVFSFLLRMRGRHVRPDGETDLIMNALYYSDPECSLERLVGKMGLSLRQVERKVLGSAGVGPKYFMRLTRFYRAMRRLHLETGPVAVAVALELGYHDQAHFIHDCKSFSGHTPGSLMALSGEMSHFYNTSLGRRPIMGAKSTKHEIHHRLLHGSERVGTET